MSDVIESTPITVIKPSGKWSFPSFREVWKYRELLYFLVWRDVKVRYKQTILGAAWAVIQPFFTMVVFSIFFGRFAKVPTDGLPYPIFAYSALIPWHYFAHALSQSGQSLVREQRLITKVYFPRLVIPLAPMFSGLVDFAIAFILLIAMMIWYGIKPTIGILALPLWTILAMMTALAVGTWLSALNVKYRDVRYTIPFLTQLWLFSTPIAYSSSIVPERWRALYGLNPMVGVVEGFRWGLLGKAPPSMTMVLISAGVVLVLLIGGLVYFRRTERTFADIV
ncbi:ABC transporter permease [Candidatus Poribacteria bacterium]|nr:ABC transporter permease [Candidatus Poribacteria bacterium]